MNNEINLVSGKNLNLEKQVQRLKNFRILAIVSLLVVALIAVFFFVVTFFLPLQSVKNQQSQTLQGISQLHAKLVEYDLVSDRLSAISAIIAQRQPYPVVIHKIFDRLPSDLTVKEINVEQNILDITAEGTSLLSMNKFINNFKDLADSNKNLSNIKVKSLQYDQSLLDYTLTLEVNITN